MTISFPKPITLYIADNLSEVSNLLAPELHPWLSEEEIKKVQRFKFADDQRLSYLSKLILRWGLAEAIGETPDTFLFAKGPHGKPYIEDKPSLHFNLSHTTDVVVLAVCESPQMMRLGVDVEQVNPKRGSYKLANRFFSEPEKQQLLTQTPWETAGVERFNHFWTLKEAFIKAMGTGLAMPLEKFHFDLATLGKIGFGVNNDIDAGNEPWHFHLYKNQGLTRVALGFQSPFEHPIEIKRLSFNTQGSDEQNTIQLPFIEACPYSGIELIARTLNSK